MNGTYDNQINTIAAHHDEAEWTEEELEEIEEFKRYVLSKRKKITFSYLPNAVITTAAGIAAAVCSSSFALGTDF